MIVTYRPKGSSEPQQWRFDPEEVLVSRMEMIERRWGGGANPDAGPSSYERWLTALQLGEARARRVLLWHLLSLAHPKLKIEDLDFTKSEMTVEYTRGEYQRMIDAVEAGRRPEAEKEQIIGRLQDDLATAQPDDGPVGKATPPIGDGGTGQP